MAIPNNYIDKIKDNDSGESRPICPPADHVSVDNENYEGETLDEVLDEVAQAIEEAGQGGYEPPEGGIPKEDLHPSVQTSLGLADTALQAADKAQLQAVINAVQTALNNLMNGQNVTDAIDTFNEVKAFLDGIDTDDPTLFNQLKSLSNAIAALQNTLSTKANSSDVANTYATKQEVTQGLATKQATLVKGSNLDAAPTNGSDNPVTSDGVFDALANKQNSLAGQTLFHLNNENVQFGSNITVEAEDGVGYENTSSNQDGTFIMTLTNGDTITVDLNHDHPQYIKAQVLTQSEYNALPTKDSKTLYIIQASQS